jgi:CheY-like chemotaxis protein
METVLAGGVWTIAADSAELENAIVNLALNSRDAMPDGGKLTIETANVHLDDSYATANRDIDPGQYVMIAVSDTGCGMTAEVAANAFDPFFTTKEVGHGTGLGLSQVYGFVKQSGGHVKIYSEPGQGTTVKLYLPRLTGAGAAPTGPAPEEFVARSSHGELVLLVEDDEDVRANSAAMLQELGYEVIQAGDGITALRELDRRTDVRLLFTDVGLPGPLNGRQLAEAALRVRPDLKALYTTGYARNAIVHNGRLDPGLELIVKPFGYAELAAKLRRILDGK